MPPELQGVIVGLAIGLPWAWRALRRPESIIIGRRLPISSVPPAREQHTEWAGDTVGTSDPPPTGVPTTSTSDGVA